MWTWLTGGKINRLPSRLSAFAPFAKGFYSHFEAAFSDAIKRAEKGFAVGIYNFGLVFSLDLDRTSSRGPSEKQERGRHLAYSGAPHKM